MSDLNLTYFDYIILIVLLYSTLSAFFKGVIRALSSFCGWIVASLGCYLLTPPLAKMLKTLVDHNLAALAMSAILSFIISLLVVAFINGKIMTYTENIRGGALDKSIGFAFGFLRGMILSCLLFQIIMVASLIASHSTNAIPDGVKNAKTYQLLNHGSSIMLSYVPKDFMRQQLMIFNNDTKDHQNIMPKSPAKNSDEVLNMDDLSKELNDLLEHESDLQNPGISNDNNTGMNDITNIIKTLKSNGENTDIHESGH